MVSGSIFIVVIIRENLLPSFHTYSASDAIVGFNLETVSLYQTTHYKCARLIC